MIWDTFSSVYDVSEILYNKSCYLGTGKIVAEYIGSGDTVLECACGTGAITRYVAPKCKRLVATDMSAGMMREAEKNCAEYDNIVFRRADITAINCADCRFDKVIAGNVIHLLDDPAGAVAELYRVCKHGGKVIIPTYINGAKRQQHMVTEGLRLLGVDFKEEFDMYSYRRFFADLGYDNAEYRISSGRMDCAIAIITKN